jgi:hypothetical protein
VWIERGELGFAAEAVWAGDLSARAEWVWLGEPEKSELVLGKIEGPAGDAMEKAGLDAKERSARLLEVMGAMAMGMKSQACVAWPEREALSRAGMGFPQAGETDWSKGAMAALTATAKRPEPAWVADSKGRPHVG